MEEDSADEDSDDSGADDDEDDEDVKASRGKKRLTREGDGDEETKDGGATMNDD